MFKWSLKINLLLCLQLTLYEEMVLCDHIKLYFGLCSEENTYGLSDLT